VNGSPPRGPGPTSRQDDTPRADLEEEWPKPDIRRQHRTRFDLRPRDRQTGTGFGVPPATGFRVRTDAPYRDARSYPAFRAMAPSPLKSGIRRLYVAPLLVIVLLTHGGAVGPQANVLWLLWHF
jgi:hypothetical protein